MSRHATTVHTSNETFICTHCGRTVAPADCGTHTPLLTKLPFPLEALIAGGRRYE